MQTLEINNLNTNTLLTLLKDGEEVILLNDGQEFAKTVPYHNGNGNGETLYEIWDNPEDEQWGINLYNKLMNS